MLRAIYPNAARHQHAIQQNSRLRTIELILGLPPMNPKWMRLCDSYVRLFIETPDFTPFVALKNNTPLDE